MLNQLPNDQLDAILLWYLVQHSLTSYRKLELYFGSITQAIQTENLPRWVELKLHKKHIERVNEYLTNTGQVKFQTCLDKIKKHSDFILLDTDPHYPQQLLPFNNHPPIIFGKGNLQNLSQPQIAIVGSRKPSPHGKQVAYDFGFYLSEKGFFITSGLAQGIDEAAHMGGLKNHRTIAVIGTGLDMVYPSQNRYLQEQILANSGTIISEYLPETQPIQRNFPYRNRIVSGLSLGVLVAEAQLGSGSLITAQSAAEQGKTIFAIPGHIYSEHHQGCHQLIREGAILVDHPEQLVEDLALPTQWHCAQQSEQTALRPQAPEIPAHLFELYQLLDWIGQDLDALALKSHLNTAELTSYLMELELLGQCIQQSGLYLRCRVSY